MEVYFWRISQDSVSVHLYSCVYKLDPFNLRFSASSAVVIMVCWSYDALAQQLSDCLLQQGLPGSNEGG